MKYRVVSTIAPGCDYIHGIFSKFDDAYRELQRIKNHRMGCFDRLEKKVKGEWVRITDLEIANKLKKPISYKEIKITTPTDTYTFKLPRPVSVPSNIDQASAALYITLDLLGVKPTVKRKTVRK